MMASKGFGRGSFVKIVVVKRSWKGRSKVRLNAQSLLACRLSGVVVEVIVRDILHANGATSGMLIAALALAAGNAWIAQQRSTEDLVAG